MSFSVLLDNDDLNHNFGYFETQGQMNPNTSYNHDIYDDYEVYYTSYEPNANAISLATEENHGAYYYKFSLSWGGNYLSEMDVSLNNSVLHSGSQSTNIYIYICAKPAPYSMDFGLMANPSDSTRNQGLYACKNPYGDLFWAEAWPKVYANTVDTTNNTMTFVNKEIQIRFSVGSGSAELYMGVNNTCVYYEVYSKSWLVSGTSATLTFMQGVSCVAASEDTDVTNGSYVTNITLSDQNIYQYSIGAKAFSTYSDVTYFVFLRQPDYITYTPGGTNGSETISISYTT